ncbi:DUF5711 family protein [Oscillospiraceae bacterium LTW-04]|nr:DUF5711 family protein [Oscillospiraceae bacterium MB24-C1]
MGRTTDFEKERKKYALKKTVRRLFVVALVTTVAVVTYALRFDIASHGFGVILSDTIAMLFDQTGYPIEITSEPQQLTSVGHRAVLVTENALSVYNQAGKQVIDERTVGKNTLAVSAGRYLLTYSRGGYDLEVRSGETVVFSHEFDYPIYAAVISPTGACAVSTAALGDQSQVIVYDSNYTQQFLWVSAERIIYNLALDKNARYIAVGGVGVNGGELESVVTTFEISTGQERCTHVLSNELLLALSLSEGVGATAVTDRAVHSLSAIGGKKNSYSLSDEHIAGFAISPDGAVALAVGDYESAHTVRLVLLNENAVPTAEGSFDRNIKSLHFYNDGLIAFLGDRAVRFNAQLQKEEITETQDAICAQVVGKRLYYATMQQINHAAIR